MQTPPKQTKRVRIASMASNDSTSSVTVSSIRFLTKNLHASMKTKDKVKSQLLLNVVIRLGMTIFELASGEDQDAGCEE